PNNPDASPIAADDLSASSMAAAGTGHAPDGGSGGAGSAVGSGSVNVSLGGVVVSSGPVARVVGDGPLDRTTGDGPVDRAGVAGDAAVTESGAIPGLVGGGAASGKPRLPSDAIDSPTGAAGSSDAVGSRTSGPAGWSDPAGLSDAVGSRTSGAAGRSDAVGSRAAGPAGLS